MRAPKTFASSALLLSMLLQGCAEQTDLKPVRLEQLPPAVRNIVTYRELPRDLTQPCQRVEWTLEEIQTDVDAIGLLYREKARGDCNEQHLKAIGDLQKAPIPAEAPPPPNAAGQVTK